MKIDEAGKNDTARRINNGFSLQVAMMRNINDAVTLNTNIGVDISSVFHIGDLAVFNDYIQFHFMLLSDTDKLPVRNTD